MAPLIGDGKGRYKVHITGNSVLGVAIGTGKSTAGAALAARLGVPFIALDSLYWLPAWKETPVDEFRAKIRKALDQDERGWVVDGSYIGKGGEMVMEECTDHIWLDPPLMLYFPRIFVRTMGRILGWTPSCSENCSETIREAFFSSDSILWWSLSHHWSFRKIGRARMREFGVDNGTNERRRMMQRLGGWGGELKDWLKEVENMLAEEQKVV